jgi:chromosome segregation ATPase
MSSDFDEFVDSDFQASRKTPPASPPAAAPLGEAQRAPTREEVEARVGEMQQKLAELKRAQQELERERSSLEETRRRQMEFTQGRQEMVEHLTRGVALLEEAEFGARRDAEQMAKTLIDLREALVKLQTIQEETWTRESLNVELTRASTVVENARMEWNTARMKFPILSGEMPEAAAVAGPATGGLQDLITQKNYAELCKLGLALTWPIALAALAIMLVLLLR